MTAARRIDPNDARLREVAVTFDIGTRVFKDDSPLSVLLCDAARHDPEILALAAETRPGSPPHFHFLCAVHALLLEHPGDPLAAWYATITDQPLPPEGAYAAFRAFALRHADALLLLLRERTIQTSTPRRAGYLLPLFERVADAAGEPLNLIEIGTSAGLLLAFDRYRYDYGANGSVGDPASPVTVHCEIRGDGRAPARIPAVGSRIGLELAPVVRPGADEIRWMTGMMFPEWREEARSLAAALDLVAASGVEFVAGDALVSIEAALARTADPVCVFHSACLYYWPDDAKAALDALLRRACTTRTIHRIGVEPPPGYAERARNIAAGAAVDDGLIYPQATLTTYRDGKAESAIVARCGRFGEWIEWV